MRTTAPRKRAARNGGSPTGGVDVAAACLSSASRPSNRACLAWPRDRVGQSAARSRVTAIVAESEDGHILTSVEKLVNSGRHFTLANVSRCSCGNGASRDRFSRGFSVAGTAAATVPIPAIAFACSRPDIARECTGINAHFPLIVCAPRVSQCAEAREKRRGTWYQRASGATSSP